MPNQTAPWWRPLTRWWGICAVIIFVGLVMRLIDAATTWYADQTAPSIESPGAATPNDHPGWTTTGRRTP